MLRSNELRVDAAGGAKVETGVDGAAESNQVELSRTQEYQGPATWGLNPIYTHWKFHRADPIQDCTRGEMSLASRKGRKFGNGWKDQRRERFQRAGMGCRRKVKMAAARNLSGVDGCLFAEQRTELVHGGQRLVGGMECRSSRHYPERRWQLITVTPIEMQKGCADVAQLFSPGNVIFC